MAKVEAGVEVPMPTLPLAKTVNIEALVEEAIVNIGRSLWVEVEIDKIASGEVVPIPTLPVCLILNNC